MSSVTLWLEISHHAAFRVGGWAFVRREGASVTGLAAGERRVDPERCALAALAGALAAEPPGAEILIHTGSRALAGVPERLRAAESGEDPPTDNLDLWAQLMRALSGRTVVIRAAEPGARPSSFAAAWAELARDRAKDKGNFSAAIPKPNLVKAGVG